jgi:hypothetical protein
MDERLISRPQKAEDGPRQPETEPTPAMPATPEAAPAGMLEKNPPDEATTIRLLLRFTGLCAFVHPTGANPKRMRVVLPNVRDHRHEGMPEHHAVLIVLEENVDPNNIPARPYFKFAGGDDFVQARCLAFPLDGDAVTVCDLPEGDSLKIEPGPRPDLACPSEDPQGFRWIARMEEAGDRAFGDMQNQYLLLDNRQLVLARLPLTTGTIRTKEFAKDPERRPLKWQFYDPGPPPRDSKGLPRAMAELIEWQVDFTDRERVDLRLIPFDAPDEHKDLTLVANAVGEIPAWIVNMPLLDVLLFKRYGAYPAGDLHFAHFYHLSSQPGVHVPFRLTAVCPDRVGMLSNPRCPPVLFNANDLA